LKDGRSTLDLFGKSFVLLNFAEANAAALTSAASRANVPLQTLPISEENVREIYERDLVLVRPDGHVAWRGNAVPENAGEIIETVRGAR
jgi:hypothetical protein